MSQTTYETISADALRAMHDHAWSGALAALDVPVLSDGEEVHPVSRSLPYFKAMRAMGLHVEDCTPCSEGSIMDLCPLGDALSAVAADAAAAQDDLAVQN